MDFYKIIQLIISILFPISLGTLSWVLLALIDAKAVLAVHTTQINTLLQDQKDTERTVTELSVLAAESDRIHELLKDKIQSSFNLILEKLESINARLAKVEQKLEA